jgi:hypothetical protein
MAATPLCEAPLAALKKSLRDEFPFVKSSHLREALAYSMGFRTNASLQAALVGPEQDRPFVLLKTPRFVERLVQLGYEDDPEFDFEMTIMGQDTLAGVVSTMPISAYDIEYKTTRQRAWRNLMVHTINVALDRKLFTLRPGDNRFTGQDGYGTLFDFELPNGLPVRGYVSDAGFDEVNVHAAVHPKGDWVRTGNAGFSAGDAVGRSWLERRRGAWLQTANTQFSCRKALLEPLAALETEPQGFGDRGKVIL